MADDHVARQVSDSMTIARERARSSGVTVEAR